MVSVIVGALARPTLFTRMSSPPNVSTVRRHDPLHSFGDDKSAATASTRVRAVRRTRRLKLGGGRRQTRFAAGADRDAAPFLNERRRAAEAPSPRLDPVTMATLSVS